MPSPKKRILCVEDNAEDCELIKTYLELEGFEVVFVGNVAEGLQLANSQDFDLYLIDQRLPDGSGVDLTQEIRAFDSKTPIVFHSANAYTKDICRGIDAGAQAFITKPSDPNEVVEVIKTLIAR